MIDLPRLIRWLFLTILLTVGGAHACASLGGAPIGEVVELVAEGGTKPLREELRPIRGTTRVIVFAFDGVGYDALHDVLDAGRMPHTAALLGGRGDENGLYRNGYSIPDVLTTLPSSTIAAWTSIFTGRPPAETGVPGNEWWSRREQKLYGPAPLSFESNAHAVRVYTDGLLGEVIEVPTLYELVDMRSHVAMQQVHRGADLLQLAEMAQFGDLFEATVAASLSGGIEDPDVYRETDQTAVASVVSDLEQNGIPDLQVVYLGGTDLITHHAEDPLAKQGDYLSEVVDPLVGRVLDVYREARALDSTYVIFISDHGHTEVLGDDRHALGMEGPSEPPAVLETIGFRVRPFGLTDDDGDFQAVLTYQGSLANVYLADRSTCAVEGQRCDWSSPPRFRDDVLAAARAFHRASSAQGQHGMSGTLDLVLAREPVPPGEATRPFEVFTGDRLVPVAEYLEIEPRPELPRLEERLRQLGEGPFGHRAGDIILLTHSGAHLPIEERFYFGAEGYESFHGGASSQDSHVPLIIAHPRHSGADLRAMIAPLVDVGPFNLVLTPLVQRLLQRSESVGVSR